MSGDRLPERTAIDRLAASWTAAWTADGGFAACCSAELTYEDPLAAEPLAGAAASSRPTRPSCARRFRTSRIERHRAAAAARRPRLRPLEAARAPTADQLGVLPATDRFLTLHGLHYLELTDGRVRRARGFLDLYDAATQLGLLPARGGWGEQALMLLRGFGACGAERRDRRLHGRACRSGPSGSCRGSRSCPAVVNVCSKVSPGCMVPESKSGPGPSSLVTVCGSVAGVRPLDRRALLDRRVLGVVVDVDDLDRDRLARGSRRCPEACSSRSSSSARS